MKNTEGSHELSKLNHPVVFDVKQVKYLRRKCQKFFFHIKVRGSKVSISLGNCEKQTIKIKANLVCEEISLGAAPEQGELEFFLIKLIHWLTEKRLWKIILKMVWIIKHIYFVNKPVLEYQAA